MITAASVTHLKESSMPSPSLSHSPITCSDSNAIHVLSRAVIYDAQRSAILLCTSLTAEPHFYYLPGGHIEHGEGAADSLVRELQEEMGLLFSIKRFLGCFEYSFDPHAYKRSKKICHTHEYNFIFEASPPQVLTRDKSLASKEHTIEFSWVSLDQIIKIDLRPESLKELIVLWHKSNYDGAFQSKMI